MEILQAGWPEPVVRVQSLSESGITSIPDRYVKLPSQRPSSDCSNAAPPDINIPLVDMGLGRGEVRRRISEACQEWGFFQVMNHGMPPELLRKVREMWRSFFHQPPEVKQAYANSPVTYEG